MNLNTKTSEEQLEEITQSINTLKTINNMKNTNFKDQDSDVLLYAEFNVIKKVLKNLLLHSTDIVKLVKTDVIVSDARNKYIAEYNINSNTIDLYIKDGKKYSFSKTIDVNSVIKQLEKTIKLLNY